jgi:hypothetical protein
MKREHHLLHLQHIQNLDSELGSVCGFKMLGWTLLVLNLRVQTHGENHPESTFKINMI